MTALLALPQIQNRDATSDIQPDNQVLDSASLDLLNHLRWVAMECRAKPKTSLFEACALLQAPSLEARNAHAEALMRCLTEAFGQRANLYRPGTKSISFDESWLVRLVQSHARGDTFSVSFLLKSRIAPENRRLIGFLTKQISDQTRLL